jgi:hypothetical protein
MIAWGFKQLKCEHCVYYQKMDAGILIAIHVDYFLTVGSTKTAISEFKTQLWTKWTVSDLGEACFCLGIAMDRNCINCTITLSQTALIEHIIDQFGLKDAIPVSTPMETGLHLSHHTHSPSTDAEHDLMSHTPYCSLVGSLMFLAIGTHPDIAHAV